ncbi:MAG: type IV pilin-like G/H family protein [Nostoc sp.]|uniref:type IV pilin-like G/H family protein n=1 Tax=Nostoc sp. TaxID=1180 RepID=UPI002FF7E32F
MNKILILAANPQGVSRLRLEEELRDIEEGLLRAKKREQFVLKLALAVRHRDIHRQIMDFEPEIVHFSGHGAGEDGLVFEDVKGGVKLVDAEALAGLFELFADHVKCVLLNACYSEIQAKAIVQHIDYVIGMSQAIGDKAAIEFAVGFYDALGAGKSVEFAYKLGCRLIRIAGIPEHLTPTLLIKKQLQSGNLNKTASWLPDPDINSKIPSADNSKFDIDPLLQLVNKLSVTAVSNYTEQVTKAKQSEAKSYIGAINRAQQVFYLENSKFASTLNELELDICSQTENYEYKIIVVDQTKSVVTATAKSDGLKSYIGVVFQENIKGDETTIATACETVNPSRIPPEMPRLVGSKIQCAPGSVNLIKS